MCCILLGCGTSFIFSCTVQTLVRKAFGEEKLGVRSIHLPIMKRDITYLFKLSGTEFQWTRYHSNLCGPGVGLSVCMCEMRDCRVLWSRVNHEV